MNAIRHRDTGVLNLKIDSFDNRPKNSRIKYGLRHFIKADLENQTKLLTENHCSIVRFRFEMWIICHENPIERI